MANGTARIPLGTVAHFGLAVQDPERSAAFWTASFDMVERFRHGEAIGVGNAALMIVLHRGTPHPATFGHLAFHLADMATLRQAVTILKAHGVPLEDPDDEIGPVAPGSPHLGLWFHDPDGYRWELMVVNGAQATS